MSLLTAAMEHCDKYLLGTVGTPRPGNDRRAIDPCPTDWLFCTRYTDTAASINPNARFGRESVELPQAGRTQR